MEPPPTGIPGRQHKPVLSLHSRLVYWHLKGNVMKGTKELVSSASALLGKSIAASLLLMGSASAIASMPDSATMVKNPSCGCCSQYAEYLESKGIQVSIIETHDMEMVKGRAGIPAGYGSCHTLKMGPYVIEGHVPFMAIDRLFIEQLDVQGITLPGMPVGSPGMPGMKQAAFQVLSFDNHQAAPFASL